MEIPGENRAIYKQELLKGVDLFEAGFKAIQKPTFKEKKEEYEKSMRESLQVVQDAAAALMNKHLLETKAKLDKDYQNYLANPSDSNRDQIQRDIDSIKKSTET